MFKKMLVSTLCMLALPVCFSFNAEQKVSTPFSAVAVAGHLASTGAYCTCGSSDDCICGPGERSMNLVGAPTSDKPAAKTMTQATKGHATNQGGLDFASGALMFAIAFMLWIRFRA